MTTISDLYKFTDAKTHSWRIMIGAVTLTDVEDAGWDFKVGVIPTAFIKVPGRAPAAAVYQARVTIDTGFDGLMERQFTGIVQDVDPSEQGDTIRCVGESWPLDVNYHEVVYTFNNVTAHDALEDLFDDSGIEHFAVSVPAWTICSVLEQEHEWETYGEAITAIGEVDGCRWYELPTGTVRIHEQDPIPAATYWRTYFTGVLAPGYTMTWPAGTSEAVDGYPRIRNVGGQSRLRDCKNRARVMGAVIDTAGGHGTTDAVDITATAYAASPWVLNPDGSQAYNDLLFNSDLIDTDDKAGDVAVRLVVANNRLVMTVNVQIEGDPEMRLCRTVRIVDPAYSGINSRWYVEGYSSRINKDDFVTSLTLIGGPEAGSQVMIDPFAVFSYSIEREVIGDKEWATVTFDATPSYDVDGHIDSYLWSDNLGIIAGTDAVMNVRCDAETTTGWLVTLTVTDNDGLTNTLTIPVDVQPATNPDVFIPALFVAFGTHASGTPDGGVTWNDQALAGCISAGAKAADGVHSGIGCFGTSTGEIYRTTDCCATAPTLVLDNAGGGAGYPVNYIWWDLNQPTVVWAVTDNGSLYWSWDDGITWVLYDDLAALFGLVNIKCTRIGTPIGGSVWVFGGTGTGYPLIVRDPVVGSHNWAGVSLGTVANSELMADLDASAYPVDLYVADYADPGGYAAMILNSATHPTAVYGTDDIHGDGSHWKRATGLPAKTYGKWLSLDADPAKFAFGFNDNVNYVGDVTAGALAVAAAAASLDVGDFPNHGIWLGWWVNGKAGTYIVAAEATGTTAGTLYKTWDRFAHVGKIRPATGFTAPPAGAKAKMVAMGAPGTSVPGLTGLIVQQGALGSAAAATYQVAKLFGTWAPVSSNAEAASPKTLRRLGANLYRILAYEAENSYNGPQFGQLQRSPDGGVTWSNVGPAPLHAGGGTDEWGCNSVCIAANGYLFASYCGNAVSDIGGTYWGEIWRSTDDGVTWTRVYQDANQSTYNNTIHGIAAHPLNQNIVIGIGGVWNHNLSLYTTADAAAAAPTFTRRQGDTYLGLFRYQKHAILANGRVIILSYVTGAYYCDNPTAATPTITAATTQFVGATYKNWTLARGSTNDVLFASYGNALSGYVARSTDFGKNWVTLLRHGSALPDFPTLYNVISLYYDSVKDTLYISANGYPQIYMLAFASTRAAPTTAADWVDISYNLDTVLAGDDDIGPHGIAQ